MAHLWSRSKAFPGYSAAYDRYIVEEVIPFIHHHCQSPAERVMANGCSMGAYHAVNFFLKHPDVFEGTIALSGLNR
jgi:esterase/lipase superfamily enzyme